MNRCITIIIVFYSTLLFSQESKMNCSEDLLVSHRIKNIKVLKYKDPFRIKKLKSFKQVTNLTPEDLMQSILSASNLAWYNYNREDKKETASKDFKYIAEASSKTYYFELSYKVTFNSAGIDYAIIKYYLNDNGRIIGFAEPMKQIDNRWFSTLDTEISNLQFFMIMFDTKYIDKIFKTEKTDNNTLNTIITDNKSAGHLNLNGVLADLEKGLSKEELGLKELLDPNRLFK